MVMDSYVQVSNEELEKELVQITSRLSVWRHLSNIQVQAFVSRCVNEGLVRGAMLSTSIRGEVCQTEQ